MLMRSFIALGLLGGCASLDEVVGGIAIAPDWFTERRVEIRGEGYPRLRDVPVSGEFAVLTDRMELGEDEIAAARRTLTEDPRAAVSPYSESDLVAMMAPYRARVPDLEPMPEGFLSEAEIAALRAQLVVPPVR